MRGGRDISLDDGELALSSGAQLDDAVIEINGEAIRPVDGARVSRTLLEHASPGEVIEGAAAMFERTRRKQAGVEADDDEAAMDNDVDEEAAETA